MKNHFLVQRKRKLATIFHIDFNTIVEEHDTIKECAEEIYRLLAATYVKFNANCIKCGIGVAAMLDTGHCGFFTNSQPIQGLRQISSVSYGPFAGNLFEDVTVEDNAVFIEIPASHWIKIILDGYVY